MELLATRNIPKDGISLSPSPYTRFFLKSVPTIRYRLAQILPQLRSKKLVSGVHGIYHGPPCPGERGEGAVTRGNEIFFYSLPSKIQSYFYLTTEEMKTFWPPSRPSTTTTVLPYCANRNIIEIRIPNSGKQFLESKTLILLLCWCWGKRGEEIKKESPIPPRRVEIPPPLNFSVTETIVNFRADNGKDPRRGSVRSFSVERDTVERVLQ